MINPFSIYPQHPDAHPERPWWQQILHSLNFPPTEVWERSDGHALHEFDGGLVDYAGTTRWVHNGTVSECLRAFDAAHPLPPPPPLVGQVWHEDGDEFMIRRVARDNGGVEWWANSAHPSTHWPPFGAVLVAGPGAPWAPAGWTPGEVTP